jgi:hypothetical protein
LYSCQPWSLALREEYRLRFFENRVLRRISGPKRNEVTEEWRRLHNEELYVLYSLPNIIPVIKSRRLNMAGHVARMWIYWVMVAKPDGRRPLDGRMILKLMFEKWGEGMDWIDLAQDRDRRRALENAVINFWIP